MTDERKLPGGRLGRFARLAALGARTGASLLRGESATDAAAKKAAPVKKAAKKKAAVKKATVKK